MSHKNHTWTRTRLLAAVVVIGMLLTACSSGRPEPDKDPGSNNNGKDSPAEKTVRVRALMDLATIDPAHIGKATDHAVGYLVYNGLVKYEVGGLEIEPDLATAWTISDDGKVYTFSLREGVKWHGGYGELTADDVVYSINRIMDPETKSRFQKDLNLVENVEAVDEHTVRFTLSEPYSSFIPAVLAFRPGWIVNQKAVEEKGENYALNPVGTGPYMFEKWVRGNEIVLKKNPDYFTPLDIDTVIFKVIKEDTVAELAFKTGDLDVSYFFGGETATRLLGEAGTDFQAKQLPGYRTQWATYNLDRPAVQDVRVRQAIIHAIEKDSTAQAVYQGLAIAVSSIFNPNIPGYVDPDPFPYDPDKARQLLKDAGYGDGLDLKVLVMPAQGWPEMATVLQDQWKKVGINAELIIRERAVYDELNRGDDFDILAQNITRADANQYAAFFYGPNAPFPNSHRYSGADSIIEAAAQEQDSAKRTQLWEQFQQKILVEDVVGFGMTNVNYVLAWRDGFEGVDSMYQDTYAVEVMKKK